MQNIRSKITLVSSNHSAYGDRILLYTLGGSLILHLLLLVLALTVEIPQGVSQTEYKEWVERLIDTPREAILAPPEDDDYQANAEQVPETKAPKTGGSGGGGAPAGGSGAGQKGLSRQNIRKAVSSSGVLGVIGVASDSGGDFADVFSSGAEVSDKVDDVLEGRSKAKAASSGSQIARRKQNGSKGAAPGAADIGGVDVESGGGVEGGSKEGAEIRGPNVAFAEGNITGGLDKKASSRVISKKSSGFRRCYERALKANTSLKGKIVFEISIDGTGKVIGVSFVEDTMRSKEVADCIKGILRRLVFPKTGSDVALLRNTLVFEPQN